MLIVFCPFANDLVLFVPLGGHLVCMYTTEYETNQLQIGGE